MQFTKLNKNTPSPLFIKLSLCFVFCCNILFSQTLPEIIYFSGRTTKDGKAALTGAKIAVYKNLYVKTDEIVSGRNGTFSLKLPFGFDYRIKFSAPGYIDMFMDVKGKSIPREKTDFIPEFDAGNIPFFDPNEVVVNIDKYKYNAFNLVIFDGKNRMVDDMEYRDKFSKGLIFSEEEIKKKAQDKLWEEKRIKDKQKADDLAEKQRLALLALAKTDKEKADLAAKLKREAENQALADAEAAKQKADEDEIARLQAEEADRLKNESMETEAQRMKREKEEKEKEEKKNREIAEGAQAELLRLAAEQARLDKENANHQKEIAQANTIIEQMKRDAALKGDATKLAEEQKERERKERESQQYKSAEVKKIIKAAASANRAVRVTQQGQTKADIKKYVRKENPNVTVSESNGVIKDIRTTVVTQYKQVDVYRKERYFWGLTSWYKNDLLIDEIVYNIEIAFYINYASN